MFTNCLRCVRAVCATLICAVCAFSVSAEMVREFQLSTVYDNNSFSDSSAQSDYITQLSGTLSWWLENERSQTQFYYSGHGYMFAEIGARTFGVSHAGMTYVRRLGEGKNRLYAGSAFSMRLGRSDYRVYNYFGWNNYVTLKWYLQPDVMVRTGYTLRQRKYWKLTTSRYVDHYLFAQINKFFPSRTTLRGDLSYGAKTHGASEGQVVLGIQVAQSLATNTGISLRYQKRMNTQAGVTGFDAFFQDADILNDRYDYSGHEWSARLTQQLPHRMRLIFEGGYEVRNYETETRSTSAKFFSRFSIPTTVTTRRDENPYFSATFELPIGDQMQMRFAYDFENNRSTDSYYHYAGRHGLSVDFEIGF